MIREILILDDEKVQAQSLQKALSQSLTETTITIASEEDQMLDAIENRFYTLAMVDLRMDKHSISGVDLIKQIIETNPFAKIIVITAFLGDYVDEVMPLLQTGRILSIQNKEILSSWSPKLTTLIQDYFDQYKADTNEINKALLAQYSIAKNEKDHFKKGLLLENFVSILFGSLGFKNINKRVIDKSQNEVDLVIRNEIKDPFLNKFGKYILIEVKNKPKDGVSKNDFITFFSKLENTNGLSELGIIFTSGYVKKTAYLEAIRTSAKNAKIIFIANPEVERLISSTNKLETFKKIIDNQVKDN